MKVKMINFNKNKRKAQISLFIIITTIIILLGFFYFGYNSDSIHIFSADKSSYKIKSFVNDCLDIETNNAVNEIGLHGGWLYHTPMRFVKIDENKYLIKTQKGFDYFGTQIPYWYYYDDMAGEFFLNIPDFDSNNKYSIRNQVKMYLDDNLERNCIKSFSAFKDIYRIDYEPKEIKTNVIFNQNNIEVTLNLPLEIKEINKNNSEFIDTFYIKQENKLRVPYYLARDIVNAQAQTSFVEKHMLNIITAYQSTADKNFLPPFYDFKLTFDKKPWKVKEVEKYAKESISSNINLLQFSQTDYIEKKIPVELKNNAFAKNFYKNYINSELLDLHSLIKDEQKDIYDEYSNYQVRPTYEIFYPTFFSLSPSFGDVVLFPKTESVFNLLPFFFTEYSAVYEITTPILFEINPVNSRDNFKFNLVIEANIDHNSPLSENINYNLNSDEFNLNLDSSSRNLICEPSKFI